MQVTNDATQQSVTDAGPAGARGPHGPGLGRGADAARQPMEAQGVIKAQLHGPRGNLNGARAIGPSPQHLTEIAGPRAP